MLTVNKASIEVVPKWVFIKDFVPWRGKIWVYQNSQEPYQSHLWALKVFVARAESAWEHGPQSSAFSVTSVEGKVLHQDTSGTDLGHYVLASFIVLWVGELCYRHLSLIYLMFGPWSVSLTIGTSGKYEEAIFRWCFKKRIINKVGNMNTAKGYKYKLLILGETEVGAEFIYSRWLFNGWTIRYKLKGSGKVNTQLIEILRQAM